MADREHVRDVAAIVMRRKAAGHRVVVVVSARAKQTDGFIDEARTFTSSPSPREIDMLLSSGERISAALLSIALNAMGCRALALSGSQADHHRRQSHKCTDHRDPPFARSCD
jgi:aspartate kinase